MPQVDSQRLAHLCGIFQILKGSSYVYETSKEKIHLAKALAKVFLDSCTLGKLGQKSLRELQGMRKGSSDAAHALRNNRLYATGSDPPYIFPSADSASQCLEVNPSGERLCSIADLELIRRGLWYSGNICKQLSYSAACTKPDEGQPCIPACCQKCLLA
jgi:hypothetical protein